jgi:hypothetical protein
MGIGVSIFLLAVGAILAFAVDVNARGIDLNAVGVILMVVGAIGLFTSFLFWDRMGFGGYRRRAIDVRDDYVDADRVITTAAPRRAVRERVIEQHDVV